MPTPQKEQIVQEMTEKFEKASGVYLMDFTGMDANLTNELRKNFREANVEYRVLKNTLAKLSLNKAGIEGLGEFLVGVNAYAIAYDDPTKPAKILDTKKEFKGKLKLKAALFEGKIVGPEEVGTIAKLPSREELIGQFVGLLQAPMTNFVRAINGVGTNLVQVLKALEEEKNKG